MSYMMVCRLLCLGGQNLVVGNIFVEGLEKLWHSATVQDFRVKLCNRL